MIFKLNKFYIDFPSKIENTLKKIPDFLIKDGISKYVNIYKELLYNSKISNPAYYITAFVIKHKMAVIADMLGTVIGIVRK